VVLKVDKYAYRRLLRRYHMDTYPRAVGFPKQKILNDYNELWKFFDTTRGADTCFTSVNSYPIIQTINGKPRPVVISVNNIFNDFDDAHKPENPLRDMRNLTKFLMKEEIPFINLYSGSKGFANYVVLKPQKYRYNVMMPSGKAVKRLTYGIHLFFQNGFRSKLDPKKKSHVMSTMDKKVMKDPKRLCRMPYSPHCNKDGAFNGRYCYPLTIDQALDSSINEIIKTSYEPDFHIPDVEGKMMTLTELTDYLDIDVEEAESNITFCAVNDSEINDIEAVETQLLLANLDEIKPCIVNELKSNNPDHDIRFAFACFMKRIGKSMNEAEQHYINIGKHFNYVDLHNDEERRGQFDNIFDLSNNYISEPSCGTLLRWGFCLKENCPKFHKQWKGFESQQLARSRRR